MMIDPKFPLIDLHRHLDGNVRLETILDLGLKHNLPLPARELEALRPYIQVTEPKSGVMEFISKFEWMVRVLVDYEAVNRIAYENIEDAAREGIDYIELRFSPVFMAEPHHLDPGDVVEAIIDGVSRGCDDFGVKARLIGILSRTYGPKIARLELDALLRHRNHIVALDLAGDEANWPAELFEPHFKRARDVGWGVTVHAGEMSGPESIWQALRVLGANRIGHGVSALEDISLIDYLVVNRIGIESCLTSNVQTSTVKDYSEHPIRKFLEYGLLATINTDDPGISNIDLRYEYELAAPAAGLSEELIRTAQRNALKVAFLSPEEKVDLLS